MELFHSIKETKNFEAKRGLIIHDKIFKRIF